MFSNNHKKKKSSPSKRTYQTALNFAPPVRVRRPHDKATAKKHKRATGSCAAACAGADHAACTSSTGTPGGGTGSGADNSKNETDANPGHSVTAKNTSVTPSPPSVPTAISTQLDDSDSGSDIGGTSSSNMHRNLSAKERRRAAAARLRERKKRHDRHRAALEDTDDEVELDIGSDAGKPTANERGKRVDKPKARKRLGQKRKNSRRIVAEEVSTSDDDDLDDFIADSSEDDDHLDDENGQEEEEEWPGKDEVGKERTGRADYGDYDEQEDEPMSHAALNFHMQMVRHDEEQKMGLAEIMSANRPLSEREAFGIWLEDLALQADAHRKNTIHVPSLVQQKAASQIERPLCTRRESALGSSAWRKEFRHELKQRPVYRSFELHKLAVPDNVSNCGACGRSSHNITHRIELSGPRYNADRTWECSRDLKHPDWSACLGGCSPETLEEDEDDSSGTVTFFVGGHCKARTQLYHDLLHYKFRVFDSIQGMLSGDRSNVAIRMQLKENGQTMDQFLRKKSIRDQNHSAGSDGDSGRDESSSTSISVQELIKNKGYVEREYERSRMLVEDAEENWGGLKGVMDWKDSVRPREGRNVIKMSGPEVGKRRRANITRSEKKRTRLQKNQTRLEFPTTKKK